MNSDPLQVRLVPKPLRLSRYFQRHALLAVPVVPAPRPKLKLSLLPDELPDRAEVRYWEEAPDAQSVVWFGAQVLPLPLVTRTREKRRVDYYDE